MDKDFLYFLYNNMDDNECRVWQLFHRLQICFPSMTIEGQEAFFYNNIKHLYENNLIEFYEELPRENGSKGVIKYTRINPELTEDWLHYQMYFTSNAKKRENIRGDHAVTIFYTESGEDIINNLYKKEE